MKKSAGMILLTAVLTVFGCQTGGNEAETPAGISSGGGEKADVNPEKVTVQHILIAFQGSIPEESVTRTREEAEALAEKVYSMAKQEKDFDSLVKEYTDDQVPGIYTMTNFGVEPDSEAQPREYPRKGMVQAFGDVGFSLKVGEIGMAEYDPETSKYGWHIIKRLK